MPESARTASRKGVADYTKQEAQELFETFMATRDPELRNALVVMHQNLVRYLAGKFASRGEPLEDLIQVGMIGLINAVDRFEPDKGCKFSTFATPTIVGEIRRHFRDKAWSLKVPRRLQELNLAANRAKERLSQRLGRTDITPAEIAAEIGVTEDETLEAIELGNAYDTVSLDTKLSREGDAGPVTLSEFLGGLDPSLLNIETYGDLEKALGTLDPRERMIITYRFFKEMSQTEVAQKLNISQMHVSRLQQKALKKLKESLTS
jgi:RNA polymerase sigma-B factor